MLALLVTQALRHPLGTRVRERLVGAVPGIAGGGSALARTILHGVCPHELCTAPIDVRVRVLEVGHDERLAYLCVEARDRSVAFFVRALACHGRTHVIGARVIELTCTHALEPTQPRDHEAS